AAAHLGREALFILRPSSPYVCIGYHQDAEQEIDLAYAEAHSIPVIRREVGGGAVYLDGEQLFYQLILRSDRIGVPSNKAEFYRQYLQPVIETYRAFGVDAAYKPVNDIIANGRKVSGNGAAEIEGMLVLVGNFIMDFDYETMSKTLRVPDEKFRDKVYKTLQENLSTMKRESGKVPSTEALALDLARRYEPLLGPLPILREVDQELIQKANELFALMYTPEWLSSNDQRRPRLDQVKIREGVYVIQNMLKTPGGLVRITGIKDEGKLRDVHISGDFFFYPAESLPELERALNGAASDEQNVKSLVERFYAERSIESPGLQPADFAKALFPAA
ncbi:MAG TPA: biotin/lipoate A/B protein ligase family protein, partial [Anaerolineales bacterium]